MVIFTASQFARCRILSEPLASVTDWWLCSVFIACRLFSRGVIFTRSRFARSTIPDKKWGTTLSLYFLTQYVLNLLSKASSSKYLEWHSKGVPNRFLAGFVTREWLIDPNPKF